MHDTIEGPNSMTVRQHKPTSANSQFASSPMAGLRATQARVVKKQEKIRQQEKEYEKASKSITNRTYKSIRQAAAAHHVSYWTL